MKKYKFLKSIVVIVTGCLILTACDKDENSNPIPDRAAQLMFNWKITGITTPKVNDPATDSSIFNNCLNDDLVKFTSTGYDFIDGTVKCDSTAFAYSKGSWGYKAAGDSIQMLSTAPAKYVAWKILSLNDSILLVRYTDSTNPAKKKIKTVSLKH